MRIFVKTLTGGTCEFRIHQADTVDHLKALIHAKNGIPSDRYYLMHYERQLEDQRSLEEYNIENDSTIVMIACFFTSNDTDPLVHYLMLSDRQREKAWVPLEALKKKAFSEGASPNAMYRLRPSNILSRHHVRLLCAFLEFMWFRTKRAFSENRVDLRLAFNDNNVFLKLLAVLDGFEGDLVYNSVVVSQRLHDLHDGHGPSKVVLRMTKASSNACTNFHCDGFHANWTTQMALNEDYKGGRLIFYANETVHVLTPPTGSIMSHPPKILRGVSVLTEGVRKSLFVLDRFNGFSDKGLFVVEENDVDWFLSSQVGPA